MIFKTDLGLKVRAVRRNRAISGCLGIDTARIDMTIFAFGSGLAGVAGAVLAPIKSVSTTMGFPYAVDSYMVLVLGGVGSLWGVLTGGALIGEAETILSFIFNNVIGKAAGVPFHRYHHPHRAEGHFRLLRATLTGRRKWQSVLFETRGEGSAGGESRRQPRRRRYRAPPFLPLWALIGGAAVIAVIGTYPYYGSNAYVLSLLGKFLCFAIFALSIDLIWGFTGILSLGQAVYFGIGAYFVALSLKINYALAHPTRYGGKFPDFMEWNGLTELPRFMTPLISTPFAVLCAYRFRRCWRFCSA